VARQLTIAVAGAGAFGREHLRTLSEMDGLRVAGIADISAEAARRGVEDFGAAAAFTDAAEMFTHLRPDGVVIATPGHTHVALASAALALDIPVLLEKPVGLAAADADALIEAERKSRAFVLPGHILRFSTPYRTVAQVARSGELGPILSVTGRNHRDETHATRYPDIDPVLMTMVHDIDMALWITGAPLAEVLAFRRPPESFRSETLMTGVGRRGCVWHISNAWTFPTLDTPPDRLEVVCERGSVELELGASVRVYGEPGRDIDIRSVSDDDMLEAEISYFLDCIRQDRRPEIVTLEDAREGLAACDAIRESLRTGTLVRV
jgi:predicted dehydrogenase